MQDAGEGVGGVALEGELAVLSRRPLRPGFLEEDARHAAPLPRPHRVDLQGDVGGRLGGNRVTLRTRSVDAQIVAFFIILVYC